MDLVWCLFFLFNLVDPSRHHVVSRYERVEMVPKHSDPLMHMRRLDGPQVTQVADLVSYEVARLSPGIKEHDIGRFEIPQSVHLAKDLAKERIRERAREINCR